MTDLLDRLKNMSPERRRYLLENMPLHLAAAGREERLREVLNNVDFLKAKLAMIERDVSPEAAVHSASEALSKRSTILNREISRLEPIAAREHWVGIAFAILAGVVFLLSIFLVVNRALEQATVSLIASIVPGFLSKVFFSRETRIEERIKEVNADLRDSEKQQEAALMFEQMLPVVPNGYRGNLTQEFIKRVFRT